MELRRDPSHGAAVALAAARACSAGGNAVEGVSGGFAFSGSPSSHVSGFDEALYYAQSVVFKFEKASLA